MAPDGAQRRRSNDRGGWQQKERPGQRQTPGTRTGLPESQRAGKPGLAMPGDQKRWCRAVNTPGAVPTLSRASESCGAPQLLKEAQGEGRNTEALLEIEHHLPQPEGESRPSSEGSFGSRNQSRTYFEKPQSHQHCSTSVQTPEPQRVRRRCPRRRRPEEPILFPALRSASSALSASLPTSAAM